MTDDSLSPDSSKLCSLFYSTRNSSLTDWAHDPGLLYSPCPFESHLPTSLLPVVSLDPVLGFFHLFSDPGELVCKYSHDFLLHIIHISIQNATALRRLLQPTPSKTGLLLHDTCYLNTGLVNICYLNLNHLLCICFSRVSSWGWGFCCKSSQLLHCLELYLTVSPTQVICQIPKYALKKWAYSC